MAVITKYVGWSAGDDYECDGTDDHVQINQALVWAAANPGNIVYLRGPFTYDLGATSGGLKIGGSTILTGDTTAVLRVNDGAMWATTMPIIGQYPSQGSITSNIEISNIKIDGNESHVFHAGTGDPERIQGKGYYNCINIRGASAASPVNDINIHDVTFVDSLGDGVRIEYGTNIRVHSCTMQNLMHSSVFLIEVNSFDVYSNTIHYITNAGVRLDHCQNGKVRSNNIDTWQGTTSAPKGGDNAVQIGNQPLSYNRTALNLNIDVHDNVIDYSAWGGICFMDMAKNAGTTPQNVRVYNNHITRCGYNDSSSTRHGAITIYSWGNGLTIENNTIENNYKFGVRVDSAIASGCTALIQNNNIMSTAQTGIGIANYDPGDLSLTIKNNYMYNNAGGSYYQCTALSESSVIITATVPGGSTDQDDIVVNPPYEGEVPTDEPTPDPVVIIYQSGADTSYYVAGRTAYIDGVPFDWVDKKIDVGNSLAQDKCPGAVGWAISDFDLEGAELTLDCAASTLEEMDKAIASFTKLGRVTVELGGDFSSWQATGTKGDYSTDLRLSSVIPRRYHPYSLMLCMDKPYYESVIQRSRSRYIYGSTQFSADDCYAGNIVRNSSFEDWTPNLSVSWSAVNTLADNEWRTVRYAKELNRFCAVAATGAQAVMLSDAGAAWRAPVGSNTYASKTGWRGLAWCAEWGLWMACSTAGTTEKVIVSSNGGETWVAKTTPTSSNEWANVLWIPPNETLTTGRALVFAQSGTDNRCMYTDNQGDTWTYVATAIESNNWVNSAYSPELGRIVVVAYNGSSGQRVMTSDDYGATWTARNTPAAINFTGVCWADALELFVAVAENTVDNVTNQQVMTSPNGIDWTMTNTPISSQTSTPTGGDIVQTTYTTPVGYTYTTKSTTYTITAVPVFNIAALTNGHYYRIDQVYCRLRSEYAGVTASIKITAQFDSGTETTLAEWTNNTTNFVDKVRDLALESGVNQAVTIRAYMKTSNSSYKAVATEVGYKITETSATGASVTYTYNQWRSVTWAREIGILVAVSQTGTSNSAMYSTDGKSWMLCATPNDNSYTSVAYADDLNKFMAVGKSGTGNRSMSSSNYGSLNDIAPNAWEYVSAGQTRSETHPMDGLYSYQVTGTGAAGSQGEVKQQLMFESGIRYVLSAFGTVSGLTTGSLRVDVILGDSVYKELVWSEDCEWTQKNISFMFSVKPTNAYIRVRGVGLNSGAVVNCDRILVEQATYYELSSTGSDITTYGSVDTTPDVIVLGVSAASESTTQGKTRSFTTDVGESYTTASTSYSLTGFNNIVFPALASGSAYRVDQIYLKIRSTYAGVTAYCKVTAQFGSGAETTLAEWTNNTVSYVQKTRNLSLLASDNSALTLRFYQKVSNGNYKCAISEVGYKVTEMNTSTAYATENMYMWNTEDPTKIMSCCTKILPKYRIEINADGTGSLSYAEDFMDENYSTTAYAETGVTYNSTNKSIVIDSGGSIVFPMDCKYPVTGIPSLTAIVKSGAPQISIADDSGSGGAPGTFYAIDGNVTTDITDTQISRLLNNITSLQLASETKFYVKITPYSTGTCEFGGLSIYAPLSTIDAERFKIYATKSANTIAVQVDGNSSAIATLRYRDLSPAR